MNKFFGVAAIAVVLSAGTAQSADLMSDPAYDWTGFYSGVDLGYSSADLHYVLAGGTTFNTNSNGVRFGTLGGYNFQTDNIVLGIESDTSFGTLKDFNPTIEKFRIDLESTFRARAGVSVDRFLPFVSAGAALAHASSYDNCGACGKDSNYQLGLAVGGGLEYAATDHLRLRAEYLYESFGKEKYQLGIFTDHAKWDQQVARAAVIWAW